MSSSKSGATTVSTQARTIKVHEGDKVRVNLHNELPEATTIHFHGLDVPN